MLSIRYTLCTACDVILFHHAVFQLKKCKIFATEPETASPFALSKKMNKPCEFKNYKPSFVDGCGGKAVLTEVWELAKDVVDGGCAVPLKVYIIPKHLHSVL